MARTEGGGLLPPRTKRDGTPDTKSRGELPRPAADFGPAPALGSPARGAGPRTANLGRGRRRRMDLASGGAALGSGAPVVGLLPRQPAPPCLGRSLAPQR